MVEADARREVAEAGRRASEAEVVVARLGGAPVGIGAAVERSREDLAADASRALADADETARIALPPQTLRARQTRRSSSARRGGRRWTSICSADSWARPRGSGHSSSAQLRWRRASKPRCGRGLTPARPAPAELGATLRELGAREVEVRQVADDATERLTAVEVELARLDGEASDARRRLEEAREEAEAEPEEGAGSEEGIDRDELAARLTRLEARRESLGKVNPLAKEEYEAEKVRLEELATQRADLEASLAELAALRDELTETVNRRFDETFAAVASNFEEVAATLFPGGEGRLRLVEPTTRTVPRSSPESRWSSGRQARRSRV